MPCNWLANNERRVMSTGSAIIRRDVQRFEDPVSGNDEHFSLRLDRDTGCCNVALDYLGQSSAKASLIVGRALGNAVGLIRGNTQLSI